MRRIALSLAIFGVLCGAALGMEEIPKAQMTATASDDGWSWFPEFTIDGNFSPPEWQSDLPAPQWLRLDLADTYAVEQFVYAARTDNADGHIKDYEIYVSEAPLDETAGGHVNWDAALIAASGQFLNVNGSLDPANAGYQLVDFTPMVGQYVYLLGINTHTNFIGAGEVWVFGDSPGTAVEAFAVSDATSGSSFFTCLLYTSPSPRDRS